MKDRARHEHTTLEKLEQLVFLGFVSDKEEAMIRAALKNDNCEVSLKMENYTLSCEIVLVKKFGE